MTKQNKISGRVLLMIALALAIFLGTMPMSAFAESNSGSADNGKANTAAYAVFDSTTGTLTFKKSSEVPESTETTKVFTGVENTSYPMPWSSVKKDVVKVAFEDVISPKSTSDWFYGMENLKQVENFKKLDLSDCSNMSYMFSGCESLTSIDLSGLDASCATDMHNMFAECYSLASVNLSGLDISNVTDMSYMFSECISLEKIDFSEVKASSVDDIRCIFRDCRSLASAVMPECAPSSMDEIFENCCYLSKVDLSGLDCSNAASYSDAFYRTSIREAELGKNFCFGESEFTAFGSWHKRGSDKQYTSSELAAAYDGSAMAGTYLIENSCDYIVLEYFPDVISNHSFKNVIDANTSLPLGYGYCINKGIGFNKPSFCNGYEVTDNDELLPWLDPKTSSSRDSAADIFKSVTTVLYYGFGNINGVVSDKNVSLQEACGIDNGTAAYITHTAVWYYTDGYDVSSYYNRIGGGEAKYYFALTGRDSDYVLSYENIPDADQLNVNVLSVDGKTGNCQNLIILTKQSAKAAGSLTVSKTVSGNLADKDQYFTFKVIFNADGSYSYTGSKSGTVSSGGTIKLKHGESVTITGLPEGTKYTVTESEASGYTVKSSNETGTIAGDSTITASFENEKSSIPGADSTSEDSPGTGDNSNLILWIALAAMSLACIAVSVTAIARKKKYNN